MTLTRDSSSRPVVYRTPAAVAVETGLLVAVPMFAVGWSLPVHTRWVSALALASSQFLVNLLISRLAACWLEADTLFVRNGYRADRIPLDQIDEVRLASTLGIPHVTISTPGGSRSIWSPRGGLLVGKDGADALFEDLRCHVRSRTAVA